ncbi:hypothetical protein M011DRAFT_456213 [Sporormia fimetaria CBS 119925]|uniref:Apple domain-containing protein n=1 Tax=Sporormia fimetaria CBS 119925 TaxID=1340428 RepID=A0A6A6VI57_9PLEO|nr:hypothetical protein M011DRAFT_456213 [Sporormia fimetaria CBS 119925]
MSRAIATVVILAALPSILAQSVDPANNTAFFTRCTTRYGFRPLATGIISVPTWYSFAPETTNTFVITTTEQETITVTPNVTACGVAATETSTVIIISTTTPAATTIPAGAGQLPLLYITPTAISTPTPGSRIKRLQVESGLEVTHPLKRQTPPENVGGFVVNPDGTVSNLRRIYPQRVLCEQRRTTNTTSTVTITGAPTTTTLPLGTAVAISTTTVTTTTTLIETAPTPKVYAACGPNNVVNSIPSTNGSRLNFDRVVYRPLEGFPIANELVVNTTNAVNCCGACQETPNCAGSFYVPSIRECHLRLTERASLPSGNSTLPSLPSGSGAPFANGTTTLPPAVPSSTAPPSTCARGSDTLFLGTIRGRSPLQLRDKFALFFSNGPCGRFTVRTF